MTDTKIADYMSRHRDWSIQTFGPATAENDRRAGVIAHIRKELTEIEADPDDLFEWVDVVILALDGAWRSGWSPEAIAEALEAKLAKNTRRQWPDWRDLKPGVPVEHVRGIHD